MATGRRFALYWYGGRRGAGRRRPIRSSAGRSPFYLFTLPAWQLIAGWLMTLAVIVCGDRRCSSSSITGGTRVLGAPRRDAGAVARGAACRSPFGVVLLDARGARLPRTVRAAVRRPHDLRRRHLHRRARHAHRHAGRRGRARRSARSIALVNAVAAPQRPLAGRGGRAGRGRATSSSALLGWYVEQLHRQAERAGARAALHRAQHRDDARRPTGSNRIAQQPFPADTRRRGGRRRATTRRRCRTSGCGTGARCRTRCGRFRKSAPTTTSPTSTSIATQIDGIAAADDARRRAS